MEDEMGRACGPHGRQVCTGLWWTERPSETCRAFYKNK